MSASYDAGITTNTRARLDAVGTQLRSGITLFGAVFVVVAAAVVLWLAFGVRGDEIARFIGYELSFVLAPGWFVYRAVASEPGGRLQQLVLGWSLGYLIGIGAFAATAAAGTRDVFYAYPLLVGLS